MNQQHQQPWINQQQQPQSEQPVVKSPIKKKGKGKAKMKDDVLMEKVIRIKWPPSDEVLMAKAWVQISECPIVANNQNQNAYWGRIADHYNAGGPQVPRQAHGLRSH